MSRLSTRRDFLGQIAGTAAAATLPALPGGRPPNVLFLMCDDLRVEIGCYGSRLGGHTPNLDALAASGVRFDRNYCQFPLCNPSRTSFLTNRHPTTTGVLGNRQNFRPAHPDWISLPQLFRQHGYATLRTGKIFHDIYDDAIAWTEGGGVPLADGGAGGHNLKLPRPDPASLMPPASAKRHVAGPAQQHMPDFRSAPYAVEFALPALAQDTERAAHSDRLIVLDGAGEGHPDYQNADEAIAYLRAHRNEPFFLGCGLVKPHSPPAAPQRFWDLYDPDRIELPVDFAAWPTVPPGFPSAAIRRHNADLFIGRGASAAEARQTIRAYLAALSFADWNLGRVLAELDRLGLRDNTIVVFIADHGYQLGEKGKWSKAGSLFEMGCRVPLIVSGPSRLGIGRGVAPATVQSIDIYPTLAALCGLELPAGGEGRSLVPLLRDPNHPWDHPAYSVWSEDSRTYHGVAVRRGRWRYAEFGPDGANGAMLFDEIDDPQELRNLAYEPDHASLVQELSALTRAYTRKPAGQPS